MDNHAKTRMVCPCCDDAKSRLLSLAETLVERLWDALRFVPMPLSLRTAFDAFTAAQAEYQTSGTVPCGECEAKDRQVAECEAQEALEQAQFDRDEAKKKAEYHWQQVIGAVESVNHKNEVIEALTTDNATLVKALTVTREYFRSMGQGYPFPDWVAFCDKHLSHPRPGDPMREELAALRKVVEDLPDIFPAVDCYGTDGERLALAEIRATLSTIRNREGR